MNKQYKNPQSRGIEWTDYTWNPVSGCQHACRWLMPDGSTAQCYAETVAEGVAQSAYPHGFAHHYFKPSLLNEPLSVKTPSRIFLDSMSDLMGHWVPEDQIESVLDIARRAHWHTFQLLTKNAPRLNKFIYPDNVWVGASVPPSSFMGNALSFAQQERMMIKILSSLEQVNARVKWMSIEPLSFDVVPMLETSNHPLNWIVIGAATNGRTVYQPNRLHVTRLLRYCADHAIPVFYKGNLKGNAGIGEWREEFPKPSVLSQQSLF